MKVSIVQHGGRSLAAFSAVVGLVVGLGLVLGAAPRPTLADSNQPEHRTGLESASRDQAARLAAMAGFGERAILKPSRDAIMGFTLSTSVQEVLVSGGQAVKAGDLLIRGDDSEDLAEAKFQRARAETQLPVDRSRAQADLAEVEYQKQVETFDLGAGSQFELDRSRVARDTAKIDLELALLNLVLSDLQATRAEARAAKLSLRAPFDGVVDIINVNRGQSVRDGEPVVRVVSLDPLWIDVPVPNAMAISQRLEPGTTAWVLLQEDTAERVYKAEVLEVAPTADAASGTRRVRVEMANKLGLVPGVNCWVRFTEPIGEWKNRIVDPGKVIETADAEAQR